MKSIYVIGSLRNTRIPEVARSIRDLGYEAFDEWYSAGPEADDCWRNHQKEKGLSYKDALSGEAATNVFNFDKYHLDRCDAAVLVLPAGRSGHLELGYTVGRGKPGFILLDETAKLDEHWYWVAGLFEGEGSITLNSTHSLTISVQTTDYDVVKRLLKITKRGSIQGPYTPHNKNLVKKPDVIKPQWRWAVSKKEDLTYIINGIYDLLSERRRAQVDEKFKKRGFVRDDNHRPHEFRWDVMTKFATEVFHSQEEMLEYFGRNDVPTTQGEGQKISRPPYPWEDGWKAGAVYIA